MPVTIAVRSVSEGSPEDPTGRGEAPPSLTFDGPRIVLGRGPGSDVRLPDPSVSLRHATIRATGADYAIVDEGSTNGTWVGGVKLPPQTPRVVRSGDLLRVGRVWLEIAIGQRAPTADLGLATRDLAMVLVKRAMEAMGDSTVAKIRVAEGPDLGAELPLYEEDRAYVVGRAERCDLPLADEDSSREHLTLTRRGSQVWVRDLGSRNGVFLGSSRIPPERETLFRPNLMLRVGRTVLALDEPVSLALADLETCDDERLADDAGPAAPPPSTSLRAAHPANLAAQAAAPASPEPATPSPAAAVPPIAQPSDRNKTTVVKSRKKRGFTPTDVAVIAIALAVIAASVAGLVWVLK